MAALLRSKGINPDFGGFHRAAEISVRAGESERDTLFGIGQSAAKGLFGLRQERREDAQRAEAAAERKSMRDERAAERQAMDERWKAEQKARTDRDAMRTARERDEGAASFLAEQYASSLSDLKEVLGARAVNPDLEQNEGWRAAYEKAQGRERDLRTKLGVVRARLSGLPAEEIDPGEPVQTSFDLGLGSKPTAATGADHVASLKERLARVQAARKGAKSAGQATFLGGLESALTAEIGVHERRRAEMDREAQEGRKADQRIRQGEQWLETYKDLPQFAGVPEKEKRRLAGQVARGNMTWQQARSEMVAMVPKPPDTPQAPPKTPEQKADEEARYRSSLRLRGERVPGDPVPDGGADRATAERKAVERFIGQMGQRNPLTGQPVPPDPQMLSSEDARLIYESRSAPPAVRALAEQVLKDRGEGPFSKAPPAQAPAQAPAPAPAPMSNPAASSVTERWERGPDGKPRLVAR